MKSTASAVWNGSLKEGKGSLSAGTGFFKELPYTFNSRFEGGKSATNPEELIAAAHAACYSMALSAELGKAGYTPESIETTCTIDLEGSNIVTSHLVSKARVPGITREAFDQIAQATKAGCPVSRALNLTISLDASLA